jgi:hypothetical protein
MSQRYPIQMAAQSSPQISLPVIVKACMSCGSVVAVSNPVQNITLSMWFIFYHLRLTRHLNTRFRFRKQPLEHVFIWFVLHLGGYDIKGHFRSFPWHRHKLRQVFWDKGCIWEILNYGKSADVPNLGPLFSHKGLSLQSPTNYRTLWSCCFQRDSCMLTSSLEWINIMYTRTTLVFWDEAEVVMFFFVSSYNLFRQF